MVCNSDPFPSPPSPRENYDEKECAPLGWFLNAFPAQFLRLTEVTTCLPHPGLCLPWCQQGKPLRPASNTFFLKCPSLSHNARQEAGRVCLLWTQRKGLGLLVPSGLPFPDSLLRRQGPQEASGKIITCKNEDECEMLL